MSFQIIFKIVAKIGLSPGGRQGGGIRDIGRTVLFSKGSECGKLYPSKTDEFSEKFSLV